MQLSADHKRLINYLKENEFIQKTALTKDKSFKYADRKRVNFLVRARVIQEVSPVYTDFNLLPLKLQEFIINKERKFNHKTIFYILKSLKQV